MIKPFQYMIKKPRQKFKYLENEKSLWGEIKNIFHHFYGTLSCTKLSQTWECAYKSFMTGGNKRTYILKQTCSENLQVCWSVCDVLEPSGIKMVVKGAKICIKWKSFRTGFSLSDLILNRKFCLDGYCIKSEVFFHDFFTKSW